MKNAVRVTTLALALLAAPASASAGTAQLQPRAGGVEELAYDAGTGEVNQLVLRYDSYSRIWTVDDAAGVTPGRGCVVPDPANPAHATCTVSSGARASGLAEVAMGDRDDAGAVRGDGLTRAVLAGGLGNDVLAGGPEDDAFWQGGRADG